MVSFFELLQMLNHAIFNKEISFWNVISFIRIYTGLVTMLKKCVLVIFTLVTVHKCGGDDDVFSSVIRPADAFHSFPSAVSTVINVYSSAKRILNLCVEFSMCSCFLDRCLFSFKLAETAHAHSTAFPFCYFRNRIKTIQKQGKHAPMIVAAALHVRMQVTPTQFRAYIISQWLYSLFIQYLELGIFCL